MPGLIRRWFASLVNRAVLFMIAGIILAALIVVIFGSLASRAELEAQARQQLSTIAELVAGDLDSRLARRRNTLAHVAQKLTMTSEALNGRGDVLVRRYVGLQHLFDVVFLFDASGDFIAGYPQKYASTGLNVASRPYFIQTSSQLTPIISDPFISKYQDKPAIMMTAPVFDHRQRFIGIIAGAVLLEGENFMTESSGIEVGKTGYVTVATRGGIVLTHGRTGSSMVPVQLESPVVKEAMAGFEGATLTRNSLGVETIMAVQQLSQVPWYVAAVWPAREAYAPAYRLTDSFILVLLGVLLLGVPIALIVFRRLMAPLKLLGIQISDRHLGVRTRPVDEIGGIEIRQVAETFNTVMEERDEVLASLAEREAFFRSLTRSAPIGIVQTDVLGRIEFANPAFEQIVGIASNDLHQTTLIQGVYEEDRAGAVEAWYQALRNRTIFRARFRLKSLSRALVWADVMTAVIETEDRTLGTVTVVRDITRELEIESQLAEERARADSERRREEERLSWEATHDSLTGLLNRRAFNASLIRCLTEMSARTNESILMLIDLDYFKPVNDEGGHLLGDDLLIQLSRLLVGTVRQSDTVARLGGDEFGIILPTCGMARAEDLAEKIRSGIEALRLEKDGRYFGVTASIGLTALASSDSGIREALARADEGTYAAKAQGRNRVIVMPSSAGE
jgi:diguanylate cyclase